MKVVIASEAKQSSAKVDCFVAKALLAMTSSNDSNTDVT